MSNITFHTVSFILLIVFVSSYNIPLTTNHCLFQNTSCNQTVEECCGNKSCNTSWLLCSSNFHCPLQQGLLVMNFIMWVLNFGNSFHQVRRSWYTLREEIHLVNELQWLGRVQHTQNLAHHNLVWTHFTFIEISTIESFQKFVKKSLLGLTSLENKHSWLHHCRYIWRERSCSIPSYSWRKCKIHPIIPQLEPL